MLLHRHFEVKDEPKEANVQQETLPVEPSQETVSKEVLPHEAPEETAINKPRRGRKKAE